MRYCLWCQEEISQSIQWNNLFTLSKNDVLCLGCRKRLVKITGNRCVKCSRPQAEEGICYDCERWQTFYHMEDPLTANYSVYEYNVSMQEMIAKWKYRGDFCLHAIFRDSFCSEVQAFFTRKKINPLLLPIPLSDERLKERGFNQATSLASLIGEPNEQIIERIHSEKQSKLSRLDRMQTTNPFKVTAEVTGDVLLIDDIYTTGRTLRHAAIVLKHAGASKVYASTLIRG